MVTVIVLVVIVVAFLIRSDIKSRRWMKAFDLHSDMFNKYLELNDDSFMSDYKWKEWLPIFEEADRICARDCPDMKFDFISSRIRSMLNDEEAIQD